VGVKFCGLTIVCISRELILVSVKVWFFLEGSTTLSRLVRPLFAMPPLVSRKFVSTNQKHYPDLQSRTQGLGTVMKYSYFSVISVFPHKTVHPFWNFFCSSPSAPLLHPIQSWKPKKNSGYTRPTLFVGWGEGLGLCELEMQKCPKTFVHDCRYRRHFGRKPLVATCRLFSWATKVHNEILQDKCFLKHKSYIYI